MTPTDPIQFIAYLIVTLLKLYVLLGVVVAIYSCLKGYASGKYRSDPGGPAVYFFKVIFLSVFGWGAVLWMMNKEQSDQN